jgi:hypothetical protein
MMKTRIVFSILVFYYALVPVSCKLLTQVDERDFAIADTAQISKIFLADKANKQVTLTRTSKGWLINNQYPARVDAINFLLDAMKRMRVNRPVPLTQHNMVVKEMATQAVKVEVYKNEKLLKAYYVGAATKDYTGDYMIMQGAEQPYVVHIPGFDGWIGIRFFTEEIEWRKRVLTNFAANEIKAIQVQYFDQKMPNSFEVQQVNLNQYTLLPTAKANNQLCFNLFSQFSNLDGLAYARNTPDVDSAKKTPPFAAIRLKLQNGENQLIELVHMPLNRRTKKQYDDFGRPMQFDSELFYAWVNNRKDFMIVQDFQLRNILLAHKNFIAE